MPLHYDPEYWAAMGPSLSGPKPPPNKTVHDIRAGHDTALTAYFNTIPFPASVSETKLAVPCPDGRSIPLTRFTPAAASASSATSPQPAVLYIHGGGMVAGSVEMVRPEVATLADRCGLTFFAVGYRLAPEHPAPAQVDDSYAALSYISAHARELDVDPARLAVYGVSGGGAPAAGVALMARDRGLSPAVAKLVLVYPMLDDRTSLAPDSALREFLSWGPENNVLAWEAVLGDRAGKVGAEVSPYAAPGRATDLAGLPATYMDCGSLDLFRGECVAFAAGLGAADVEVEFHVWPGLPHGFEGAAEVSWTKVALASRIRAIQAIKCMVSKEVS